jgi:hypothetical protein
MHGKLSRDERGAPYRHRLEVLASGVVEELVASWAAARPGAPTGEWRRIYGKLRPQRPTWATLVHQADDGTTVAVRLHESTPSSAVGALVDAGDLGVAELQRCAEDPALPSLGGVLAALDEPRVVRYHPGNRCMVRGGRGGATRFVKVFAADEVDEVDDQAEARQRWEASRAGSLSFAVAEPHGWDESTRSSWYGEVPGTPIERWLAGRDGAELARRVGRSLGELATSSLRPASTDDDAHQLKRTRRSLHRAAAAVPALGPELDRALELLAEAHAHLRPRPLVPIHGAAHLGQWLVDDTGRLGLVDFDRFALGEPEFDLATFLVEAVAAGGARARGADAERLRRAVLDGYPEVAGALDEDRLRLYLLHKRLGRVVRAAAGLRPGGPERAAQALTDVMVELRAATRPGGSHGTEGVANVPAAAAVGGPTLPSAPDDRGRGSREAGT